MGLISCSKEEPAPMNPATGSNAMNLQTKEAKPKYDDIACYIADGNGNSCTGQRCGSPNGDECRKKTTCKCDETKYGSETIIFENYTVRRFNAMWSDSATRAQLIQQGYYEQDEQ